MDVHRSFAVVAILENGQLRGGGRVDLTRDAVTAFGRTLCPNDEVVIEATVNTAMIVRLLRPFVGRVAVANPLQVRVIAHAKVKTDKVDAAALAKLHASGFLPEVWMPDEATEALRRLVAQRAQVVQQMTRAKNRIHGILHANLIPPFPGEVFSAAGRVWLETRPLAADEMLAIRRYLADLDQRAADLVLLDQALAGRALEDERVRRLMTLSGVHVTVAMGLLAAVGDISRFASPEKLVSYLGLNPSVRQSGGAPAHHGRITKQGRSHARAMLVEAAWAAARAPGPLRAFFLRIQARRGKAVAAVATARKLAVLAWHLLTKAEDYAWARPALVEAKLRKVELAAGQPAAKGPRPGRAHAYNSKEVRARERAWLEQTEQAYARFVANWQSTPPTGRTGAANGRRTS
ncbi:IS110 family RNA-guided transposase [Roseomonas harenae]|uniref:IS110 family transposase n=1 Tax=Muricoccus harenae TaxID=2692566 RepID=UPI001331B26F|nr:IS110 family transposase [Roseomonas harenae]